MSHLTTETTETTEPHRMRLLARALLLGVGPHETARALSAEFGWDAAVLTLAQLAEPQAGVALGAAVAAQDDLPAHPRSSQRSLG